jgi:hypothetical protein
LYMASNKRVTIIETTTATTTSVAFILVFLKRK